MNETLPFDDTNDSEVSETIQESGDDGNRPEDVSPGVPYGCGSEFIIIKLKVEGKDKRKFFAAMTVSSDPFTVNFMKRLSKSTFAFP